ncbi:beta-lactamase family protein [Luteibacter aegosomaticola]|uniref:serine hydrolase domain-containing protein n=1 Tax=Luteibacter aegosomaticola TaxID=2911538 RepID=UPI001FFAC896|nr:serine hydrolase domain-containing protein [Luteibacter aegosomaticola]UPG91656.1 beta-lactamase family protein [Luteibacter aegosomaticola]
MELDRFVRLTLLGASLCAAFSMPAAAADGRERSEIAMYVRRCGAALECNGTYLVAQHGQIVYEGAVGRLSSTRHTPLTVDSAFDIGSITKQFTAAAIVRLAEQQRVALDDPAAKYLPGFPYPTITLRQLLNQTSGVPDVMPHYTQVILSGSAHGPVDLADIVEVLREAKQPLITPPGAAFGYSNTGYSLLGKVIENASGKTYAAFLQDEFFVPLGMTHTWVRTPSAETLPGTDRAYGMRMTLNGSRKPVDQIPGLYLYGAGGVYSTTGDLLIWATSINQGRVMSAEHWREATTPATLADGSLSPYGFGLSLKPSIVGGKSVSHGGHWRGFKSDLTMLPDQDTTIVILTNNSEDREVENARNAFVGIMSKAADATQTAP